MTLQTDLEGARDDLVADAAKMKAVVNGPATGASSTVAVDSGTVKTLAKAIADLEAAYEAANTLAQVIAARDKAQQWAEEVEDTEVETGQYSALHHAAKAAASAASAASSAAQNLYSTAITVTTNTAVGTSHDGNLLRVDTTAGPVTLTLDAIATLGDGFRVGVVRVAGTDAVTVQGTGGEQLNGQASLSITSDFALLDVVADAETTTWTASGKATLGLGSAAVEDVGSAVGDVVQLENVGGVAGLPAVDGRQVTGLVPAGAVIWRAVPDRPDGYLDCDGSAISRTTYATLLAAISFTDATVDTTNASPTVTMDSTASVEAGYTIEGAGIPVGTTVASVDSATQLTLSANATATASNITARFFRFGAGDGSTTFNVPDLRGEFIRGYDNGRGVDSGRVFGAAQAEEIGPLTLNLKNAGAAGTGDDTNYVSAGWTNSSVIGSTAAPVLGDGTENRPRNIALSAFIKY